MLDININFLAVLAAAIASMILGAVWYAPPVFGKIWMKMAGITPKDAEAQKKEMPKIYGATFIGALIQAYVLGIIISMVGAVTIGDAIRVGFLTWLGFVATTTLSSVLYEGKKQELYLLNNSYSLLSILTMSVILIVI